MNKIAYTGLVVFVTAAVTLAVTHFLSNDPQSMRPPAPVGATSEHDPKVEPRPFRKITLEELATHNKPDDCWMAIRKRVYDFTDYIPKHPTAPSVMHKWCGKDATEGWDTKGYGRPHSKNAENRLDEYFIGVLADE